MHRLPWLYLTFLGDYVLGIHSITARAAISQLHHPCPILEPSGEIRQIRSEQYVQYRMLLNFNN